VLDATGTERAVLAAVSCGALWATVLAGDHPGRVTGIVAIGPAVGLAPPHPERAVHSYLEPLDTEEGWAKYNQHYWLRDFPGFLDFFSRCLTEPHSTKQHEDCVGWGLEITPGTLIDAQQGLLVCGLESFRDSCARVRCPVLVIHGDEDAVRPHAQGRPWRRSPAGAWSPWPGRATCPGPRPGQVNRLVAEFVGVGGNGAVGPGGTAVAAPATRTWTRALRRPRRALYLSSPIGLGHARRDLAIARELRRQVPGLEIDWLAQDPVTRVLAAEGEQVHPASAWLANESAHIERESAEHDLHAFQAIRRMDEILVANYMVFHDVVREEPYDLWVGDEAWELDYYLHENPEQKRAAYVWLTDVVGWLPWPTGASGRPS
jgi:hypothetical protein